MLRTLILVLTMWACPCFMEETEDNKVNDTFTIEGKVLVTGVKAAEWLPHTRILVDGGQYVGFLRADGAFKVTGVPSGSYVVEVANPTYVFEPARVDITAKGKMRARKVNHIQSNAVVTLPYPLRFKSKQHAMYFQKREEFRITDMLKNPMVLMMILPLIFIVVLPKLINTQDPEIQKEMQNMNLMNPKTEMPDLSEMMAKMFGGGSSQPKKKEKTAKIKKIK
ncbi:ER membrane protein complex subunit 7-like [Acanthaster planci]|uniref:ER membrane protein complex subunit 7-like n=1 Tax=Acanthaster planci TaxID=133434 RepID=A0A8B7Y4V4_ACAPL|nr:ER membrane protein complex subunit 7-like [Acanthaster planci]